MERRDLKALQAPVIPAGLSGFRVNRSYVPKSPPTPFGKKHFYKIVLVSGAANIRYGSRNLSLSGLSIFFANPEVPYSVEIISEVQTGFSCVFSRDFIKSLECSQSIQQSPLFRIGNEPAYSLTEPEYGRLAALFELMIEHYSSTYQYNEDLMRCYLQLIIHETHKLRTSDSLIAFEKASLRVTRQFFGLLERQFPIENVKEPIKLRTAQDFANRLSIHVNYLNRAVKDVTGQSTTALLAERVTGEAQSLLQHTDWSINEIAYALGFEYSNYFSNFIRKTTGQSPRFFRTK